MTSAYPLQALLGLRERAKEEAGRTLAAAAQALAREEALRAEQEAALAQARAEREAQVQAHLARVLAQGAEAGALLLMGQHEARLKDREAAQARALAARVEAVAAASRALEAQRTVLAEAARELRVLEEHRDRWMQERRRAREAREEQAQEEVGSALFLARQRK